MRRVGILLVLPVCGRGELGLGHIGGDVGAAVVETPSASVSPACSGNTTIILIGLFAMMLLLLYGVVFMRLADALILFAFLLVVLFFIIIVVARIGQEFLIQVLGQVFHFSGLQ